MSSLHEARAAFDRGAWAEALASLQAIDARTPLDPDDLDRLAAAGTLVGKDADATAARTRAHAAYLERGEPVRAANSAFWLAFTLIEQPGQQAQAAGWFARARRLIEDAGMPCVEEGWLLCAAAYGRVLESAFAAAHAGFAAAVDIGRRFESPDLIALARHGQGRSLLRLNRTSEGLALLDEVMIGVTGGEVGPLVTGVVYCGVIGECHQLFDLRRAHEWTAAMERWCAAHPDLVPFRAECVVHRSEALQWHGFFAPAATSDAVINQLHGAIVKALGSSQVKSRLAAEGASVVGSSPTEFAAFFQQEISKWTAIAKRAGIQPE